MIWIRRARNMEIILITFAAQASTADLQRISLFSSSDEIRGYASAVTKISIFRDLIRKCLPEI